MKYTVIVAAIFGCVLHAQAEPGAGRVEGAVLDSLTRAPVRSARVTLSGPKLSLSAESDAEGKFHFTAVPPGSYKLAAKRLGYSDQVARHLAVVQQVGDVTGAEIDLPPQGSISGRVLEEDGTPMWDARVSLMKENFENGRREWDGGINVPVTTDGEYRFPNLPPGRYVVRAYSLDQPVQSQYQAGDSPLLRYPSSVYYPNALTEATAAPIQVDPGANAQGMDIHIAKVVLPAAFHVSGKVTGATAAVSIGFSPSDSASLGGSAIARPPDFAFDTELRTGSYTFFASPYGGTRDVFASGNLAVTGDVTGLVIGMARAPVIQGRISLADGAAGVSPAGISVQLAGSAIGNNKFLDPPAAQSDSAGRFAFAGSYPIVPGRFSMRLYSLPEGCFVQEVKLGGHDVPTDDIPIQGDSQLEIVLDNTAGTIAGTVTDSDGRPILDALVALVPAAEPLRIARQHVNDSGAFSFTRLAPGKYKLIALEGADDSIGLLQDPAYLQNYASRAQEVAVGPKETQSVQVKVPEK